MQERELMRLSAEAQAEACAAVDGTIVGTRGEPFGGFDELVEECGIVGIGAGVKEVNGVKTGEPAVLVFVERKVPDAGHGTVPDELEGMQTDVQEVGRIVAGPEWLRRIPHTGTNHGNDVARLAKRMRRARGKYDDNPLARALLDELLELLLELCGDQPPPRTGRFRPVPPGVSVGHVDITAGTAGLWVEDVSTGEVFLLSNNHVLANSNVADLGDPILQPGRHDSGSEPNDVINQLAAFEPIDFGSGDNAFDAAIAGDQDPAIVELGVLEVGPCPGYKQPGELAVGQSVQKSGRTTGLTRGTVNALGVTVDVGYGNGRTARFTNQVQITPGTFSDGGDSGSAILDDDGFAVALLYAGSDFATIGSHIAPVLEGGLGRTLKVAGT